MAQAVNIVLADAQATPVNHTFIPLGPEGSWDMVFEDQSTPVGMPTPMGFWRIYVRLKRPSNKTIAGQNIRVELSLQEPVLEAIAPAASGLTQPPTVAYVPRADLSFAVSDRSVEQNRKDLRKMLGLLVADVQIVNMVEKLIPVW